MAVSRTDSVQASGKRMKTTTVYVKIDITYIYNKENRAHIPHTRRVEQ